MSSQNFYYRHYTTEDGLPSSCLYSISQDKYGFLWIATDRGLSRFDGSSFHNFDVNKILPTNIVFSCFVDHANDDDVLVGCMYGTCMVKKSRAVVASPIFSVDSLQNIDCILRNRDVIYLYTSNYQIKSYDVRRKTMHADNLLTAENPNPAASICLTKNKQVISGRLHGLFMFKSDFVQTRIDIRELNEKKVTKITENARGHLFVSTPGMIYELFQFKVIDSICPDPGNKRELAAFQSNNGTLWIIDRKGNVFVARKEAGRPYVCNNITQQLGLKNAGANNIIEDAMHNVWITTFNHGLYCVYNSFSEHYAEKQGLNNTFVNSVFIDRSENIFLCTHGGAFIKSHNGPFWGAEAQNYSYQFLPYRNKIICLMVASDSYPMPEKNVSLKSLPGKNFDSLIYIQARRAFIYKNVIATYQWNTGIAFSDLTSGETKFIDLGLTTGRVNKIYTINGIDYWIGTTFGLVKVNYLTGKSEPVRVVRSKVNDILYGRQKTFFIAADDGLYYLSNGRWQVIREYKGRKISNLSALAIDQQDRLWVGTNNGILLGKTGYFQEITGYPNIISNEINCLTYDSAHGKMYVGTYEGLSVININLIDSMQSRLPNVEGLYVQAGDSVYDDPGHIVFTGDAKNITLHYTAVELMTPKTLRFKYKVDDSDWEITPERSINIPVLLPGEHHVFIQASANGVHWGRMREIRMMVPIPFYRTMWFRILALICLLSVIYIAFQFSMNVVRKRANEKIKLRNEIEELRYQELGATINPHFIFNALASIQSYINTNEKLAASEYLAKFSRLIRMILYKANSKKISIHDELQRMEYYVELEMQRGRHGFKFVQDVAPDIDIKHCYIPNMIIQPLLENAISHGIFPLHDDSGVIKLIFRKENDELMIEVRDNGIGIESTEKKPKKTMNHNSIALKNITQRIGLIEKAHIEITNKSRLDERLRGTLIRIGLPWIYTTEPG